MCRPSHDESTCLLAFGSSPLRLDGLLIPIEAGLRNAAGLIPLSLRNRAHLTSWPQGEVKCA